jgi:hypothetical protein
LVYHCEVIDLHVRIATGYTNTVSLQLKRLPISVLGDAAQSPDDDREVPVTESPLGASRLVPVVPNLSSPVGQDPGERYEPAQRFVVLTPSP